jgi:hypothetical protein
VKILGGSGKSGQAHDGQGAADLRAVIARIKAQAIGGRHEKITIFTRHLVSVSAPERFP